MWLNWVPAVSLLGGSRRCVPWDLLPGCCVGVVAVRRGQRIIESFRLEKDP